MRMPLGLISSKHYQSSFHSTSTSMFEACYELSFQKTLVFSISMLSDMEIGLVWLVEAIRPISQKQMNSLVL